MSSPEPPSTGAQQVLSGRYEIHRKIARGGMAEVFLARDRSLDRPVAVKVLFPEFATDPAFVERFRREAQAAANLSHPNIVGVYDWGAENGTYFIVMEYVDGKSLAEIVRTSGPLHPRRAAEVAFEVAGALGFADAKGVVHRDVKPGNVIISTSGVSKVTDFGIARALSSPSEDLTAAGAVMGTASYFSPEQAQGFPVDARSDLYSLGVVLFELVTGRAPFTGDSPVAIVYKHVQEQPPRPSDLVAGVPVGLEAIIGRLLAKQPDHRYLSADDLRADLRRWLDGDTPVALAAAQGGVDPNATVAVAGLAGAAAGAAMADATRVDMAPVPPTGAVPITELDPEDEEPPRRTALFVTLLLVLLAVVAGLVFWLVSSLNEDKNTAKNIEVPALVDLTQAQAEKAVTDAKLKPRSVQEANDTVAEGIVFGQSPKEGDLLAKGDEVLIKVSSGPETIAVPSGLVLQTYDVAEAKLKAAGFTNPVRQNVDDDKMPVGLVIRTDPTEGALTPLNSPVNVYVSTGPQGKAIPTVAGLTTAQAKTAVTNEGFKIGDTVQQPSNDVESGRVIGTDPTGKAPPGATINLIVSTGAQQVAVPSVKGQTEAEATATLRAMGLQVEVDPTTLPAGDPNVGRVIDVDPKAATMVDPGSTVTVKVGVAGSTTSVGPGGGVLRIVHDDHRAVTSRGRPRILPPSGAVPTFAVAGLVLVTVFMLGISPSLNPIALLTGHGFDVDVPDVVDLTQPRALLQLEAVPLAGRVTFAYSSKVPRGIVVTQIPRAGSRIRRDSTVRLVVSRGPNRVTVPSVVGEPESQARRDLRRVGLASKVQRLNDEVVPKGQVVRQSPGKDVVLSGGEQVDLVVSLGPFVRTVPQLAGTAVEGALFTVGKTGLALGTVTMSDDANVPEGVVIATDPPAGTVLPRDTPVNVVVSNGPPPVAVPGLVGGQQANVVDQLTRLGLVVGEVSAFGVPGDPGDGTILDQSPPAGTMVRRGQVVTLTVRRAAIATTTTAAPAVPPAAAPAPGGP